LRTGFFARKIKANRKVSYAHLWTLPFYSDRVKRDLRLPDALRQLSLLGSLSPEVKAQVEAYAQYEKPFVTDEKGKLPPPPEWGDMSLRAELMKDTETFPRLKEKFGLSFKNKTVLLFPGSVWATKRWTAEGFIATGQQLAKLGYEVIVMGGPGEEFLAEHVASQIPSATCLAAKTQIYESAQLILHASLLIGNDSASAHLASACETPLIAIFGPTILKFGYRPWAEEVHIIERKGMACRPCGKHGHNECPLKTHACMKEITSSEVVKTAEHILK
jgi:heptosyltransferase-2